MTVYKQQKVMSNSDGFMQANGMSHKLVVFCIRFGVVFGCWERKWNLTVKLAFSISRIWSTLP